MTTMEWFLFWNIVVALSVIVLTMSDRTCNKIESDAKRDREKIMDEFKSGDVRCSECECNASGHY